MNFFVLLHDDQNHNIKRLDVTRTVQDELEAMFRVQEAEFLNEAENISEFDGGWKPDQNEHLLIKDNQQGQVISNIIQGNSTAVPTIGATELCPPRAKAIFTGEVTEEGIVRVLMQRIDPRKYLSPNALFALVAKQDRLTKLEEPVLSLDSQLLCIITGADIQFKRFHNLKMVFNLKDLYKTATDRDVASLAAHENIEVGDLAKLMENADTQVRKLLYSIKSEGVLDQYMPSTIKEAGDRLGVSVIVNEEKLVIPQDKRELKTLLRFMDDSIYEAELTGNRYETNSKRIVTL